MSSEKDCKKKQLAGLVEISWFPEIDAYARKHQLFNAKGKPDRTAAMRMMVRIELDKLGYQLTEEDALWVLEEIRRNKNARINSRKERKNERN